MADQSKPTGIQKSRPTNFEAAQSTRRLRMLPRSEVSINSQIRRYGPTVIARSRYLTANNPYAASAKDAFVSALVGDGIRPSIVLRDDPELREAIQMAFSDWSLDADYEGRTDFYGLQQLIGNELHEAGECFVRFMPSRGNGIVPLQLHVLPAEMCPWDKTEVIPGSKNTIEMGIEFDSSGKRTAYHFHKNHPNSENVASLSTTATVRIPADQVLHIYRRQRSGQIRGLPAGLPVIRTLAITDAYEDAELERKRTAALFSVFITRPVIDPDEHVYDSNKTRVKDGEITSTATESDEAGFQQAPADSFALEPGLLADLEEGEQIQTADPADVGGGYEDFMYRQLTAIAAGYGVPYLAMTGDLRQTSFGSQRAGLIEFRRKIKSMQDRVMAFQFGRPVWSRWLVEAVLSGVIPISPTEFAERRAEFHRVKWLAPKFEWIDPLKDLQSEDLAVKSGFKARSDVIEEMGGDPFETDIRMAEDKKRAEQHGLTFGESPKPKEEDDENEEDNESSQENQDEKSDRR